MVLDSHLFLIRIVDLNYLFDNADRQLVSSGFNHDFFFNYFLWNPSDNNSFVNCTSTLSSISTRSSSNFTCACRSFPTSNIHRNWSKSFRFSSDKCSSIECRLFTDTFHRWRNLSLRHSFDWISSNKNCGRYFISALWNIFSSLNLKWSEKKILVIYPSYKWKNCELQWKAKSMANGFSVRQLNNPRKDCFASCWLIYWKSRNVQKIQIGSWNSLPSRNDELFFHWSIFFSEFIRFRRSWTGTASSMWRKEKTNIFSS